ncbi:hypothetical protein [Pseudidiomarina insulisalsae]|uniref:Uncharacterized protein n=1 Tax=Pseudidiomarina insulisalsae TaxID=575789 RepID=A0A432YLY0_9GAMM|nr:hypothetical protein [Pseudidiomarina insulisalsae]RUO61942.1 hypothetical protein CWI71_06195 [Pseudidiomarina insulisalsae]
MKRYKGYILFELVIAISLLSALLLFSQQWLLHKSKQQQQQSGVSEAKTLLREIERFWLLERRIPGDLNELVSKGYLSHVWQPWPQPWMLSQEHNMLRLRIAAPDYEQALWLSQQIAGAHVTAADELSLHVFEPVQLALQERYLQRVADPLAPQYNQMEADLDMNGYKITNVDQLDAKVVVARTANLTAAQFELLRANELEVDTLVATQASISGQDLAVLADRVALLQQQWQQCRAAGGCQ